MKRPKTTKGMVSKQSGSSEVSGSRVKALLKARAAGIAKGTPERGTYVYMRPTWKDGGGGTNGDGGPKGDPCKGYPFAWPPAVAVKVAAPPPDFTCPSQATLDQIRSSVASNLSAFHFPDPDVRVSCAGGSPAEITIEIWPTKVPANSCDEQARERATLPDYFGGGFALYVNAGLIRNLANAAFDNAPKRLDGSGAPSGNGPIHLTGLSVDFVEPDISVVTNHTVKTYVTGYDERPWPDVGFTVTLTDVLDVGPLTANSTSNVQTDGVDEVLAILLSPVAFALSVFPPLSFLLVNDIEAAEFAPHSSGAGGAGAGIVSIVPTQIPLPHTGGIVATSMARSGPGLPDPWEEHRTKLVINYLNTIVNESGMYLLGTASLSTRTPSLTINGPASVVMDATATQTFGYFSVVASDFFGPLSIAWTCGGGDTTVATPNVTTTTIYFRRGNAAPGSSWQRTVTVQVVDSDRSSVSASLTVTIAVLSKGESLLPVCKIKPWLPECQPK